MQKWLERNWIIVALVVAYILYNKGFFGTMLAGTTTTPAAAVTSTSPVIMGG
jgi:hypothetical protein